MEVYIKGGHGYDCYDYYDAYIMLYSAIIAVYSKGVFPDVISEEEPLMFRFDDQRRYV